MNKRNILQLTILILAFAYFLIGSTIYLDRLGVSPDEAYPAINALTRILPDLKTFLMNFAEIRSFYIGRTFDYLLVPFFLIFGKTVFVLRITHVVFIFLTLICIYYALSRWFNKWIALITILLLCTNSFFIRAVRIGVIRQELFQIFLFWTGIAFIQMYLDYNKKLFLYLTAFIFGLAISAKIMFLAYLLGILVAIILLWKKSLSFLKNRIFKNKYDVVIFIILLAIGSIEFILYNIRHRFETLRVLWYSLWNRTLSGWDNLSFINNLSIRIKDLGTTILGENIDCSFLTDITNEFNMFLFILSLIGVISYLLFKKSYEDIPKDKLWFILITYFTVFISSCFIPTSHSTGHLVILYPVVQILGAVFIFLITKSFKGLTPLILSILILIAVLIPEFIMLHNYIYHVKNGLGYKYYSGIIDDIAHYLKREKINKLYSSTWDIQDNIDFITNLEVLTTYIYPDSDDFVEYIYNREMKNMERFYLIHDEDDRLAREIFIRLKKLIKSDGRKMTLIKIFTNKMRNTIYKLYSIS